MLFLWVKAIHIIAVISWMAGLLYLPRLFVYHADTVPGSSSSDMLKIMERRLIRYIMNPAMILTWVLGLWMVFGFDSATYYVSSGWFHVKLLGIVALTVFHHKFSVWRKALERDERPHTARVYRIANEGPTLAMIIIVIMVVVKPF